ncbi:macro domain-containing protein [Sphingobacteriaceae bacterium WQ 2009]|uniref:Macro domain-containing protein n=1 Tax=Rhinopithecimicrobium faecis TaxID=2820698 RepID=A0A8T4HIN5_9SPHI|nr:macro domain-containing protein [Sphingobacteriaceae bacterium WQ 2009]
MIKFIVGNLLDSKVEALVNTVNTDGVMGKGIALQFKNQFPNNYKEYVKACKEDRIGIGKLLVFEEETLLTRKKIIINFPTKTTWRKPSEYSYIEAGLQDLLTIIRDKNISSIAIPPLGAGNGGLEWMKVKQLMITYLSDINCDVYIYEPNGVIQEVLKKERVTLTPARAMLLSVLYEVVKNGEFVSEFTAEKIAYFLQRFGAKDVFKLAFKQHFYGPYSGKVKHVLYHLNGSYIAGYSSKDKKPFEEIGILIDTEKDIIEYLSQPGREHYLEISNLTKEFLTGFYSAFGLELLSTVDFIRDTDKLNSVEQISSRIEHWSDRKRSLFTTNSKFIERALKNINNAKFNQLSQILI